MFIVQNYGHKMSVYDTAKYKKQKNPRPYRDGDL